MRRWHALVLSSNGCSPLYVFSTYDAIAFIEEIEVPDFRSDGDFSRYAVAFDFGRDRFPIAVLPFSKIFRVAKLGLFDYYFRSVSR
jgi:hypothetical protein